MLHVVVDQAVAAHARGGRVADGVAQGKRVRSLVGARGLQRERMALDCLQRGEGEDDDVRPVRLHVHMRLLGLVADGQAGGELGAEALGDGTAVLGVVGDDEGSQGIEGRAGKHVRPYSGCSRTSLRPFATARGVSNSRRARVPGLQGPVVFLGCYTFAMVTPPFSAIARSPDRGAWPWRRCRSLARS